MGINREIIYLNRDIDEVIHEYTKMSNKIKGILSEYSFLLTIDKDSVLDSVNYDKILVLENIKELLDNNTIKMGGE